MRDFNVLLTCCGMHVSERVRNLKENEDGTKVKIFACNSVAENLPYGIDIDGCFVVSPISSPEYFNEIIDICLKNDIDIIIPSVSLELMFMAKHKEEFERNGIKVSISSLSSLKISNNKLHLAGHYGDYMPPMIVTNSFADLLSFDNNLKHHHSICVKLPDRCGGNGFAIIDDNKARDMSYFNRRYENHYISYDEMEKVMSNLDESIIVQEYIDGVDYSVSVLADKGDVIHECGYYGYAMQFGAIEYGEIAMNSTAYSIANKICNELELDGNVCFDFRITPEGEVFLLEINPRVNASLPFVTEAGINMLYLRCKGLLGFKDDTPRTVRYGLKMKKYHESRYF